MDDKLTIKDAITVLRNLQDWLYFSSINGGTRLQREAIDTAIEALKQPDIIYCKDCVKHNKGLGNYEVHPDGSGTWIWKDSACPLVSWRDKAQGHEFDYQFCAYAERGEVTT